MNRLMCIALIPTTLLAASSLAAGGVTVTEVHRKVVADAVGPQPLDGYHEKYNQYQYGPWQKEAKGIDSLWELTAFSSADTDSITSNGANSQPILDGSGAASATYFRYYPGCSKMPPSSANYNYITFTCDSTTTWSLDYMVEAVANGDLEGLAMASIGIANQTTGDIVVLIGDKRDAGDGKPKLMDSGSVAGMLPAGHYYLFIKAEVGFASQAVATQDDVGTGNLQAKWSAKFSLNSRQRPEMIRVIHRAPIFDPGIVFEDVLVNFGREQFAEHADVNRDGRVDTDDVIDTLDRMVEKSKNSRRQASKARNSRNQSRASSRSSSRANATSNSSRSRRSGGSHRRR